MARSSISTGETFCHAIRSTRTSLATATSLASGAPVMWVRSEKYRAEHGEEGTLPRRSKPKRRTSPPSNGFIGSLVPFMIKTEDVHDPANLHLKFSGVGTFAPTAATARKREGASSARRYAM